MPRSVKNRVFLLNATAAKKHFTSFVFLIRTEMEFGDRTERFTQERSQFHILALKCRYKLYYKYLPMRLSHLSLYAFMYPSLVVLILMTPNNKK